MTEAWQGHRSNVKPNKKFKSRHATKGTLKNASKGRTEKTNGRHKNNKSQESKAARRNKAKQLLKTKRDASKAELNAPRVIAIVSLCSDIDPLNVLQAIFPADQVIVLNSIYQVESHPTLLQFLTPAYNDLLANVDACLAADYVILGLSSAVEVEHYGENLLRCITSLGVTESGIRACVPSLPAEETAVTHAHIRKSLLSFTNHFFPSIEKIHLLSNAAETTNLIRSFKETTPRGVVWREERARVLVEQATFAGDSLQLTGTVRGAPLDPNKLLHIPGYGDVQISRIERAVPYNSKGKQKRSNASMDVEEAAVLAERDPEDADDLQSENELDAEEQLLAEQTWPTEEEMQGARAAMQDAVPDAKPGTTPKSIKRVPKGTSEYQAAWILDDRSDDGEDESDVEEDGDQEMDAESEAASHGEDEGDEELDDMQTNTAMDTGVMDNEAYESYRAERRAQAQDDADFPDEVDTPQDRTARERFAKFRGLKSFRTSTWDPFENLPLDYSKCFMFENYKSMSRNVVRRAADHGVPIGTRVVLHLVGVTPDALALFQRTNHPATVFALHRHEHKFTVMHFSVLRNTEYEEEVRSKDPVVLMLGPRRFIIQPLFSQLTQKNGGKGSNNVHKFHRFAQHGSPVVGSAYLPATFGSNTPALLFNPNTFDLISSGSLLSSDPTRIIAKRIILTGHPYKLHKRTATIRYMFFNTEDIHYFKPIELHTKKGRKGHIKESLGTHGYFKAVFDGPMDQMDTVCLNLYKRCFPKWGRVYRDHANGEESDAHGRIEEVQDVEMD